MLSETRPWGAFHWASTDRRQTNKQITYKQFIYKQTVLYRLLRNIFNPTVVDKHLLAYCAIRRVLYTDSFIILALLYRLYSCRRARVLPCAWRMFAPPVHKSVRSYICTQRCPPTACGPLYNRVWGEWALYGWAAIAYATRAHTADPSHELWCDIRLLVFPVRSPTTRPFLLRGSNFAHGALETEEIRTELKKSPAFVLIIKQYNSQSVSEYMYVSVNMKENEY